MRHLILTIIVLISFISNAQKTMCDSIMQQMDVEIENAKKNGADATMLKYLEQAKKTLREQYCKDNYFYNSGGNNGSGNNNNANGGLATTEINNEYVKTKPYNGAPFYGKQKISIKVISSDSEGTHKANYSYYINKEGSLILLDKECLQNAGLEMIPQNASEGTFQYWCIRNDGLSSVFGLSDKNEKIASTYTSKNFLIQSDSYKKPTFKKLNQNKMIAGYSCSAYEVVLSNENQFNSIICWVTTKPMLFQHDILPFTTMFMADKMGFQNLKNHGILEFEMKKGADKIHLSVTEIKQANKTVSFNGYTEYFLEY
ncbi:conserved exported hypothetical protein [Flavobacterium sp. 9AF]|uniref:hypothetical protein n=1 Tax=Flavobacterium sp. 9AF TaxID=2653142 RepID=UPI0012F181A8|nr:hypothetical protein [Flavobacterium sp. 9AF]VXB34296.1 conserved exported hypothetical protein [Flavobacterium sp. 9AF]